MDTKLRDWGVSFVFLTRQLSHRKWIEILWHKILLQSEKGVVCLFMAGLNSTQGFQTGAKQANNLRGAIDPEKIPRYLSFSVPV